MPSVPIRTFLAALAALAAAATAGFWLADRDPAALATGPGRFERHDLAVTADLFAIGTADLDGDGRPDIFTANHSAAALYLRNRGGLAFADARLALGLSGNPDFPDAEIAADAPPLDRPGLFLFWQEGRFRIVARGLAPPAPLRAELALNAGIVARATGGIAVEARAEDPAAELPTRIVLRIAGDGELALASLRWAVNGRIALDPALDLAAVFVGQGRVSPSRHAFDLVAGADRHAVAWTDLDGDGRRDAVFADGGEAGLMRRPRPYPVAFGTPAGFAPPAAVPGLVQEFCPTREIRLVDADGDGRLDIHVVCGRGNPPRADHPDELFLRRDGLRFENRAAELGLDLPGAGRVRWFDAEGDGVPELLRATPEAVTVLARREGRFVPVLVLPRPGRKAQVALGDIDGDGAPDLYVASPDGTSLVIRARAGALEAVEPETLGLPRSAACATFVDADNDGADDLHVLPGGLYRNAGGRFEATGLLAAARAAAQELDARCLWLDADGDGFRDLLVALPAREELATRIGNRIRRTWEGLVHAGAGEGRIWRPLRHRLVLYRTVPTANAWLAVALAGPPGNPDGLGARITVTAGGRIHVREIGHAEGSTSSEGAFEAHFGLGGATGIDALEIRWPGGGVQRLEAVPVNRFLRLAYMPVGPPDPRETPP